jgi:hypothetical protein
MPMPPGWWPIGSALATRRTRARQALEQATIADDSFVGAHITLATLRTVRGVDAAIDRYRHVVAKSPDALALNNSARALATQKSAGVAVRRARTRWPTAVRGYRYPGLIHLLGNDVDAQLLIANALRPSRNGN